MEHVFEASYEIAVAGGLRTFTVFRIKIGKDVAIGVRLVAKLEK
jgi:hypothetical protein